MSILSDKIARAEVEAAEASGVVSSKVPRVPLAVYVSRVKRLSLDPWQKDLCVRLEKAFWLAQFAKFEFVTVDIGTGPAVVIAPSGLKINKAEFESKKGKGCRCAIHAPPQAGKSCIISQAYPGWIFGYDPIHRFRLATYNITHSKRFSGAIRRDMATPEYRSLFPSPLSQVDKRSRAEEWSTAARLAVNDGQSSFMALGLSSGYVGSGADTSLEDDPYSSAEDALSQTIRDSTWRFHEETVEPRLIETSNSWIMFHRYHQDDQGGRAIATGRFDLLRYAAEADGDYIDDDTGIAYSCLPLFRKEGEYLSPRFPQSYYLRQRGDPPTSVWWAQFQGRPTAKSGNMFNVNLMGDIHPDIVPKILHRCRAWDNAATEGAGAFTAGVDMGIDAAENIYIFGIERKQVGTAERQILQEETAQADGPLVQIHFPIDPGSAGKDVAFEFEQTLSRLGFIVITAKVSGSKEQRAYNFSKSNNSGKVFLVLNPDGSVPDWHKVFKNEAKYFPNSTYKDQIDAGSDAYNHLMHLFRRGLCVKHVGKHNLVDWDAFSAKFGRMIPEHWEVHCCVRLGADSSKPSGFVIMARAAEDANIGETVFIVASGRMFVDGPAPVIVALKAQLNKLCAKGEKHPRVVWVRNDGGDVVEVSALKYGMNFSRFEDEVTAGLPETNWYFDPIQIENQFYKGRMTASHAYILTDPKQIDKPVNDDGQISIRQDGETWSYNDKGLPQSHAGISLDCGRICLYNFALTATALTKEQKQIARLPEELRPEKIKALVGTDKFIDVYWSQQVEIAKMEKQDREEAKKNVIQNNGGYIGRRAVTRRHRK